MLRGVVRERFEMSVHVEAGSVDEALAQVRAQLPAGFELEQADPVAVKGSAGVVIDARAARYGERRTVEGATLAEIRVGVAKGWQLVSVVAG